MSDQYDCHVTEIAGRGVHLLLGLVVCADVVAREIPPLIAKGRIGVLLVIAFDFVVSVLKANDSSGKDIGRFEIGIIAAGMALVSYFSENFLQICVDLIKNSELGATTAVPDHFIKALRWNRWTSILYTVGLLVALEVTPTNAVMAWCHGSLTYVWTWMTALGCLLVYLVRIIRNHAKEVVRVFCLLVIKHLSLPE